MKSFSNCTYLITTEKSWITSLPRNNFCVFVCPQYKKKTVSSYHFLSALLNCTEVRFASFFSGGFTTMAVINQPEKKMVKRTSVNWFKLVYGLFGKSNKIVPSISNQNRQKGIKCTKAKELSRAYCPNIYIVVMTETLNQFL